MTTETTVGFYQSGGTLSADAPSYIERQADHDLFTHIMAGEFCYVLTARQVGKSSLMVRAARRLKETGVSVGVLDLTAIGQNVSAEQWYDGLLSKLGRQLDLEDEVEQFWTEHSRIGPVQRFMTALHDVILARTSGQVAIFIDEIDQVRSLPFATDEFFAAIRECYNRRATDAAFQRLTFCLIGVATPSDLIADVRTTPFNIGRRIELSDFTREEAEQFAQALAPESDVAHVMLERVLYWTGGHPYLTQRLCAEIAARNLECDGSTSLFHSGSTQEAASSGPHAKRCRATALQKTREVDAACSDLFYSRKGRGTDDNLAYVENRILRSDVDVTSALDTLGQVVRGRRVKDDVNSSVLEVLRLSGIVQTSDGWLKIRNRIYSRAFDRKWVARNMPVAELRRQRRAYLQGLLRAALVFGVFLAVVGFLAISASHERNRAENALARARRDRDAAKAALVRESAANWKARAFASVALAKSADARKLAEEKARLLDKRVAGNVPLLIKQGRAALREGHPERAAAYLSRAYAMGTTDPVCGRLLKKALAQLEARKVRR